LALILTACSNKKEPSLEEILATNNVDQITSEKIRIDTELQELTANLNKLNRKLNSLNKDKNTPLITTFKVQEQVFTHYIELQGNVQTKQNVLVYPEVPGILKEVLVKEGQYVKKGQLLAVIDDGGLAQQVMVSQTNEQLAKTTFERQKRLWNEKIGSEIQYLQAKASYKSQKNATNQLKQQLGKFKIIAPFSGIIDDIFREKGTVVAGLKERCSQE